jgi:integrase/recombinase XerC
VHVPHDPTPPWEKRRPYDNDEIAALLDSAADPFDRVLVLLGAHGGLRAGACVRLRWRDVNMTRRDLTIRLSKGGKTRTVGMSASVKQALQGLSRRPDGYVLPYRTPKTAWMHITTLCEVAGVAPKGMHSLRHSAGTRLHAETGDLEETARHLGHTKLDTTRIYAKWNDRKLRETLSRW